MEDQDLDDAALWASVDTAAAEASRRAPSRPPPSHALSRDDDPHRGEVLQPARPFKLPRVASHGRATPPPPLPSSPPPYMTPDASRRLMLVQSPHPELPWVTEPSAASSPVPVPVPAAAHGLFPSAAASVASFRKYQEVAVSILDKSDYTLISGNPYIKKSGWRKISCFYNISFEIKDHSIEFDDSHNVNRAEFLVRASMQTGRFSDGWGSCDRREKRFNKPNHDIPSTAETRAKNKACQAIAVQDEALVQGLTEKLATLLSGVNQRPYSVNEDCIGQAKVHYAGTRDDRTPGVSSLVSDASRNSVSRHVDCCIANCTFPLSPKFQY